MPQGAAADTIAVTSLADSGPGSLRQAIADAPDGSTITVPVGTITLASPLAVAKSLTITGAGPAGTVLSGGHSTRVMTVSGAATSLTLDGLAITEGSVVVPHGIQSGAGVLIDSATVVIRRSTIANNAIDVSGAGPGDNGGIAFGAGVSISNGKLTIEDSRVTANSVAARGGSGRNGGVVDGVGVSSQMGQLTITRSRISGNTGDVSGGMGPASSGQNGGVLDGGGVYSFLDNPLSVADSTVDGNAILAAGGPGANPGLASGGGLYAVANSAGSHTLSNLTASSNTSSTAGGGGADGGGLSLNASGAGAFDLSSSTIAGNGAADTGGGNLSASGTVRVANTIVAGGVGAADSRNCTGPLTSLGHNLDSLDQCQFHATGDKTGADPKLGVLEDNGGPVPTQAIPLDSPAFDAGDAALCPPADARGVVRQGARCDIGAFELELVDLGLAASAGASHVKLGSTLTLVFTATNRGPGFARRLAFRAQLPSGLEFVSAATGCAAPAGLLSCSMGDVAPGFDRPTSAVVRAVRSGLQSVTGRVASQAGETVPANNTAAVSVTVDRLAFASVKLSRRVFRLGRRLPKLSRRVATGTTIRFALPEAARVKLSFAKRTGKRKRFRTAGSFTVHAHAGTNRLRFQGSLSRRRRLKPGRYRLTLTAVDALGNRSAAKRVSLRILPPVTQLK